MKKYFETAERRAHNNFSNYNGGGWNNFVDPYNYADGGNGMAAAKASLPYTIKVQNTTASDVSDVVLLGANANLFNATNFGNPAAIVITMLNGTVTYTEFLENIKSNPFRVGMTYVQTLAGSNSQPFEELNIEWKEPNGRAVTIPVSPALDPMQNQAGVTIINYEFPVNAFTTITTNILASTTVAYRLYPMQAADLSRSLSGQSVEKAYARPNLSQFQVPSGRGLVG